MAAAIPPQFQDVQPNMQSPLYSCEWALGPKPVSIAGRFGLLSERFDYSLTIDRAVKMAFINPARDCQPYGGRNHSSLTTDTAQYRTLAAFSPSTSKWLQKREASFIKQHYFCPNSTRFFYPGPVVLKPSLHQPIVSLDRSWGRVLWSPA